LNSENLEVKNERETSDMCQRITQAHIFATSKIFTSDMIGGVHALSFDVIKALCVHINVQPADSFWDIGVGLPLLAFSLSAAAINGIVLGSDIRK
jgi:hypothetical protein